MELISITTVIVTSILLTYASISDLKARRVHNVIPFTIFIIGMIYRFLIESFGFAEVSCFSFFFVLGFVLWNKRAIGGADSKVIAALSLVMPYNGVPEMFVRSLFFITLLILTAVCYTILSRLILKKEKEIPFIPIIFMSYLFLVLFFIK